MVVPARYTDLSWNLQVFHTIPKNSPPFLGGGFKYVLFSPLFGEDVQFD